MVPRRGPVARVAVDALPLPAGGLPVRAAHRGERRARPQPAGVRAAGHRDLRQQPLLEDRRRLREGDSHGHLDADPRHEHGAGRRHDPRASDGVVPQRLGVGSRARPPDRRVRRGHHRRRALPGRSLPPRGRADAGRHRADAALLRQRDEQHAALRRRRGAGVPLPEGRHQRPRRVRRGDRQPRPPRDEGGLVVPGAGGSRSHGRAPPAHVAAGARRRAGGGLAGEGLRRPHVAAAVARPTPSTSRSRRRRTPTTRCSSCDGRSRG